LFEEFGKPHEELQTHKNTAFSRYNKIGIGFRKLFEPRFPVTFSAETERVDKLIPHPPLNFYRTYLLISFGHPPEFKIPELSFFVNTVPQSNRV
jgi:hypothetical protein